MECSRIRAILLEHTDMEIPAGMRESVEAHLARCSRCAKWSEALGEQLGALRSLPKVEAPPRFLESIHERLERRSITRRIAEGLAPFFDHRYLPRLGAGALAAALVIISVRVAMKEVDTTKFMEAGKVTEAAKGTETAGGAGVNGVEGRVGINGGAAGVAADAGGAKGAGAPGGLYPAASAPAAAPAASSPPSPIAPPPAARPLARSESFAPQSGSSSGPASPPAFQRSRDGYAVMQAQGDSHREYAQPEASLPIGGSEAASRRENIALKARSAPSVTLSLELAPPPTGGNAAAKMKSTGGGGSPGVLALKPDGAALPLETGGARGNENGAAAALSKVLQLVRNVNGKILSDGGAGENSKAPETLIVEMPSESYAGFLDRLRELGKLGVPGGAGPRLIPGAMVRVTIVSTFATEHPALSAPATAYGPGADGGGPAPGIK